MSEVDAKREDPFLGTFDAVYTRNLQVFKEDFQDPGWQENWAAQCRIWSQETADQRQAAKLDPLLLTLASACAMEAWEEAIRYASCFRVVFCSPAPFELPVGSQRLSSLIAWSGPHKLYKNIPQMFGVMPDWLISSAVLVVIKQTMQLVLFSMYRLSRGIQGMEPNGMGRTGRYIVLCD